MICHFINIVDAIVYIVHLSVSRQFSVNGLADHLAPTVDGNYLPAQPFEPQAPEQSKDIPVMLGTTIHEFSMSTYVPQLRTATKEAAMEYLRATKFGDRTEEFAEIFEKTYPDYQPKDLFDTDITFRPGTIAQANVKVAQQGAPVYMYMFTWESSCMNVGVEL